MIIDWIYNNPTWLWGTVRAVFFPATSCGGLLVFHRLANPFSPAFLAPTGGQGGGQNQIAGGMIFFGGGVPLYQNGKIIGGLGISGDTSCTDHEIAKRVRTLASMDPPGGPSVDDITYSSADGASVFTHPL